MFLSRNKKRIITAISMLFTLHLLGQVSSNYNGDLFYNDSSHIWSVLNNSDTIHDVSFGTQSNGIYRTYRHLNHEKGWCLISISHAKDSQTVFIQKPYDWEGYFELNWLVVGINNGIVTIPYDNGNIWQIFSVKNRLPIGNITTYYRNGEIKEVLNIDNGIYKEYYEDGKLKLIVHAETIRDRNSYSNINYMKAYKKNGSLLFTAENILSSYKNEDEITLYSGEIRVTQENKLETGIDIEDSLSITLK
ncbi:MAG: toxin-antitoxin system YwqK family antitoxin [Chitinophagales bacterium]